MKPNESSSLPAETNPLWRWERPWFFAKWIGGIAPLVFVCIGYTVGFREVFRVAFGEPSCGLSGLAEMILMPLGIPLGVIASALIGAAIGGILDCFPNQSDR